MKSCLLLEITKGLSNFKLHTLGIIEKEGEQQREI